MPSDCPAPRIGLNDHPGAVPLEPSQLHHLVARYGSLGSEVLDLIAADGALSAPIGGAERYLAAEVAYAASEEGALHIDDVLTRRTHIAFEMPDRGRKAASEVAHLMAPVLARTEDDPARDSSLRGPTDAEAAAQALVTDAASEHGLVGVRDPRPRGIPEVRS